MRFNQLDLSTAKQLETLAYEADKAGVLQPGQLQTVYSNKWFKMFVPREYGGLQISLPEALRIEEDLARIDGSLGWTITLCAGANMFVGYMQPEFAQKIFLEDRVCLGGSGASTGTAEILDDGYRVNGFWRYATGAPHLTHFTANCYIVKEGSPLLDESGSPLIQSFLFEKDEVMVVEDWDMMGLKATASHSFEVKDLKVARDRSFIIDEKYATIDQPVYQYPFLQFAETTIAVNSLGMAENFLDQMFLLYDEKNALGRKDNGNVSSLLFMITKAHDDLERKKDIFYSKADHSWQQLISTNQIDTATLADISDLSRDLARSAREIVSDMYPFCGMKAAENGSVLNRIFRDIFTGSQHALLNGPQK